MIAFEARNRQWFSPREIADLRLGGLPKTREGIHQLAMREGWRAPALEGFLWRHRAAQGGGIEYSVRALPLDAQIALMVQDGGPHLVSLLAALCARLGIRP